MNDALISAITDFTLAARELLTREAGEQLEGIYGWLPDGTFGEARLYPALAALPEAAETRRRLELYAREETEAGVTPSVAREKLKREAAFTWLNRAAAFRLLEERKLIKPTLARLHKSNGYIFWLTSDGNEANQALYEQGTLPLNLMGEGPADVAYRCWLLAQCEAQSAEVSVLFDPGTLATRLCPRPATLRQLVESMNVESLAPAWQAGNEETVGWLYQAFNANEEATVRAGFLRKLKVKAHEIPAVTQLFTPRWVVRYLVENTLGRLWLEMHPDSRLKASLGYWVPVPCSQPRSCKPVKEITFLDPCCGSMHFGLLAFDLFADMYREERENAGQPGWPAAPSAATEEEIPSLIAEHNLHGMDLDARAVQLSALAILLRARTVNQKATITDRNLACANVEQITGGQLEKFVKEAKFSNAIYERILRRLASRLKDSEHLGSLLRIESEIDQLIATERQQAHDLIGQLPGLHPEQFDTQQGAEEFFGILSDQIVRHLDHFAQSIRSKGELGGHFAGEAAKGLRVLRLAQQRYDVVATNPPYLDSRDYSAVHKAYLESVYPAAKRNLFAAFIPRCSELCTDGGLIGMITGQSFMFIQSYTDLRKELLDAHAIETLSQYDYHLFAARVDTAAFVLRKESDTKKREAQVGTYFRLVKEKDAETKRVSFEMAIAAHQNRLSHPQVFVYKQADFDAIPDKPWTYWMTPGLRHLFTKFRLLGATSKPRQGLATSDNGRFLRQWWEVGAMRINRDSQSSESSKRCGQKWFPYNKGGAAIPWHSKQQNVVNWRNGGSEIDTFERSVIRNPDYYFRPGVTWTLLSPKGFAARLSPAGFVFDVNGMTCFPSEELIPNVLGLLNSRVARFLLAAINPTIAFQVGDIERLPVPSERSPKITDLVNQCVEIVRQDSVESETTYDFIQPLASLTARLTRQAKLQSLASEIDLEFCRLYGLSPEDLAAIDRELSGASAVEAHADAESVITDDEDDYTSGDLSPADLAISWVSYAIGTVLGRFAIGEDGGLGCGDFKSEQVTVIRALIDADGIMPCEKGHPQDLAARAATCLALMLGEAAARDTIRTATGETGDPADALRTWLDRFTGTPEKSFWKYHHQHYRKRPIYWPLQSPEKHFTVWVFQERFTKETLFTVKKLAEDQRNLLQRRAADLRPFSTSNRAKAKALDDALEQVDDVSEFITQIEAITQRGYTPCIDDGVLLNAAPLHTLLPSWPETKKAWQEMEAEKYEWAHQAMLHWPERVRVACKTNKSFAIAHGLA